jgi:4'-phosphopantetheinyl transferase
MDANHVVHVLYTSIPQQLPDPLYREHLSKLPKSMQDKNRRFLQQKDKLLHLYGKLLLLDGLELFGFNADSLNELKYNEYDRPYLSGPIDFNISHSGDQVVCAIANNVRVGIDIEEIKPTSFNDFQQVMTDEQWRVINNADDSLRTFYTFWTIKESVIKADSRGLSMPLNDIHISRHNAQLDNRVWHLHELKIHQNYCTHLASDVRCEHIHIKQFQ